MSLGASGGLLTIWDDTKIESVDSLEGAFSLSNKFRNKEDGGLWIHSNVYGSVDQCDKEEFRGKLAAIGGQWDMPWCFSGDFNATKSPRDRCRGRINRRESKFFNQFIVSYCLLEQ